MLRIKWQSSFQIHLRRCDYKCLRTLRTQKVTLYFVKLCHVFVQNTNCHPWKPLSCYCCLILVACLLRIVVYLLGHACLLFIVALVVVFVKYLWDVYLFFFVYLFVFVTCFDMRHLVCHSGDYTCPVLYVYGCNTVWHVFCCGQLVENGILAGKRTNNHTLKLTCQLSSSYNNRLFTHDVSKRKKRCLKVFLATKRQKKKLVGGRKEGKKGFKQTSLVSLWN